MKKKIFITLLLSLLILTSCGGPSAPGLPDNLGGGGTGSQTDESKITTDDTPTHEIDTKDSIEISLENVTNIDLSTIENTTVELTNEGTYVLTGNYTGRIVINGDADKIIVVLNSVNITLPNNDTSSVITFKKHSGTRILHVLEDSINTLSDHTLNDDTGDGSIIQAKKSSLIINGSGTLNINGLGTETTGIKVKNQLEIYDTTINLDVTDNGIKSGDLLSIKNSNINIKCLNDGIKTDVEAETEDEGNELTQDIYSGYLYINNSNITIDSKDDGIAANSYLKIDNTTEYTINITTNDGAPNTITETSSDNADGKAIRVAGITLVTETEEIDLLSQYEDNYLLVILGGKFIINSNDDAVTSKGNLIINDGDFTISTGDDGIHAEYLTKIFNGNISVNKCYEGIEGASVEIIDGTISVISTDDGINAANGDLTSWDYNIYIGGGDITINASGDGIDSNGTIEIANGKLVIFGPINNANAALDADKGILMNGGILLAFGSSGMVETPSSNSKQNVIVYNLNSSVSANTTFKLVDSNNNVICELNVPKKYQSTVVSFPELVKGSSYTITCGSNSKDVTITSIITSAGSSFGGSNMGGGHRPW